MKLGPYETGNVYCGDAAVLIAALPDNCINLTVTSPRYDDMDMDFNPIIKGGMREYDSGSNWDFKGIAAGLYRVTKPGGVVVWVVSDPTIDGSESLASSLQKIYFRSMGFNVETMIYEHAGTGAKGSKNYYWQGFEYMLVLSRGTPKTRNLLRDKENAYAGAVTSGERLKVNGEKKATVSRIIPPCSKRTNVWRYTADRLDLHPAPFPEALARDHIVSWSNPGDVVLDCFAGSGTSLKMAKENGREFLGFELSLKYVEIAKHRIAGVLEQIG